MYIAINSQNQILAKIQVFADESMPLQGGLAQTYGNVSTTRTVQVTLAHSRNTVLLFASIEEAAAAAQEAFGWQGKVVAVQGCADAKIIVTRNGVRVG